MERDKWKCKRCGCADKTLNVHHLEYLRNREPWEYADDLLVTLCDDCHNYETEHQQHTLGWLLQVAISALGLSDKIEAAGLVLIQLPEEITVLDLDRLSHEVSHRKFWDHLREKYAAAEEELAGIHARFPEVPAEREG
jgi:hypothetical protein